MTARSMLRRFRERATHVAVLGAATVLLLVGCGGGATSSTSNSVDRSATLRVVFPVQSSLDPAQIPASPGAIATLWPVYDRLLQVSEDGKYRPMLATSWQFSQDGKTLTLDLRKGVTFSDGTPFGAHAVKANIDRYKSMPATKADSQSIASAEVAGDHLVKLHLTSPTRAVLNALATSVPGIMVSPKALHDKNLGTHPVGTGAWVVESFRPGQEVVYKRRADRGGIWDPKTGKVAQIDIKSESSQAAYSAIRSGQADMIPSSGDNSQLSGELKSGKLVVRPSRTTMTIAGIYLNHTKKPFADDKVRKAVNYAIDRAAIVKAFSPVNSPRVQPFPDILGGFDPSLEHTYTHDPGKARKLLAEAGYPHCLDAGTFLVANFTQFPQVAQSVQAQLAEVGIKITLRLYDVSQLITHYSKSDSTGMITWLTFPSIEAGADFTWLYDNPLNMPGGVPESVSAKFASADDPRLSEQQRDAAVRAVNTYATRQALFAPIWQGVPGVIMTDKVRGFGKGQWFHAPYGAEDFRRVWLAK